ncbi:MAG: protein translocase subunit SecD [Bacteroides sp.]|nr:protein translocase subunit SecD [Bacillota bacterium]MCM1394064.1 protein translocase subunit SecD [[Eubacterium] siraeum]MCM1455583.1 protein translocase subunit SecD [Bacteroides sp.]
MNKKKSIVVLTVIGIFVILMAVFAVVSFPIGDTVYDYTGYAKTIKLGLDMSGGVSAVFEVLPDEYGDLDSRVDGTISSLQSLLVSKGYTESTVTKGTNSNGNTTIRVEVPDVEKPEKVLSLIGRPASLEFKGENSATAENLIVGRDHLETAYVTLDDNNNYAVGLKFNSAGADKFSQVTSDYLNKSIYIFIDGELYTNVNVNSQITNGNAIITSGSTGYTYQEALDFATRLQSGTFGVSLKQTEVRNISATLGENSINIALIAGIVGVALIFIFLAIVYRGLGIAADLALCVYIVLLLWFCAMLPWVQLTLPGIAGLLLSIGMAVDANVIIFERIKDEYRRTNKPIQTAIKDGFKRSTAAIIDGNVTTLIGAIVLWILGSASIVGFAVTLFIGIILSMFTSLVMTRLILKAFMPLNSKSEKFYGLKRAKIEDDEFEEEAENVKSSNKTAKEGI